MKPSNCLIGFAVVVTLVATVESMSPLKEIDEADGTSTQRNPLGAPITDFSFDFLRALHESESSDGKLKTNVVFSPSNIFRAFLLLSLGTNGDTKSQLRHALRLQNLKKVTKDYKTWKELYVPGVLEADRLYHDNSIDIKQRIKTLLTEDIHKVEMGDPSTIEEVNQWVSSMTQGNIPELLSDSLENIKLLIVSVVYMRAQWEEIFVKQLTTRANFQTPEGPKEVNMMYLNSDMKYVESSSLESQVVSLPYKDSPLSFLVFLPDLATGQTVDGLISSLSRDEVKTTVDSMTLEDVQVRLPKFKIENEIDLIPRMTSLGANKVFTSRADLSGFTDQELYVEKALHKVVLEVDEEGTTAAAATGINAAFARMTYPKIFTADHPFVYMIYDRVSEMPLFVGVMMDPTQ